MSKRAKFFGIALALLRKEEEREVPALCVDGEAPVLCVSGEAPVSCMSGEASPFSVSGEDLERAFLIIRDCLIRQGLFCVKDKDEDVRNKRGGESREKKNGGRQKERGCVSFIVVERGEPCCAQVKLFPLEEGEFAETFCSVNGRIDMIREVTRDSGMLKLFLPAGRYWVEVSKGSEYDVIKEVVMIGEGEWVSRQYELEHRVDLRKSGWYAGDLHHHSIYSSPVYGGTDDVKESPEEVCRSMRAMGASFGALSDHHNIKNHPIWLKQTADGFVPICSKEISTSNGHVLALNVMHDVVYRIPSDENRTDAVLREEFVRIIREIQKSGGLAQLNHPRDDSKSTSWNPEFYDMLPLFDTIEIWNGSHPMCGNTVNVLAGALWRSLLEQGIFIPATTGSDTHNIKADDYHELMDELCRINKILSEKQGIEELKKYSEEMRLLSLIGTDVLPLMEEWAEANLTSAGVRTYVKAGKNPSADSIIKALKAGNSFLTNGPILLPTIKGKGLGEAVELEENRANIEVQIYSNHSLSKLYLYRSKNRVDVIYLTGRMRVHKEKNVIGKKTNTSGYYSCSLVIEKIMFEEKDYLFLVVMDNPFCMAITNPIFITKGSESRGGEEVDNTVN